MAQTFGDTETLKFLTDPGTIKFDVYMFVCHTYFTQVAFACEDARGRGRDLFDEYVRRLDEILTPFFEKGKFTTCEDACESIALNLKGIAKGWARAAHVLDSIAESIISGARKPIWGTARKPSFGIRKLEEFHALGRRIARAFFDNSSQQVTQGRLDLICRLVLKDLDIEEDSDAEEDPEIRNRWSPLVYRRHYRDPIEEGDYVSVILCRFTPHYRSRDYLAFPFFFAHEYTAHIFAFDHQRSQRFQDGWMLYALDDFIRRRWANGDKFATEETIKLDLEQVHAFKKRIYGSEDYLGNIAQSSCSEAEIFDTFLRMQAKDGESLKNRFMAFVYELTAYNLDLPGVSDRAALKRWPAEFIDVIADALATDASRSALLRVLRQTQTAQELWSRRQQFDL